MTSHDLKEFLLNKMVPSEICQPLVIKTLVDSGGSATIRQLAVLTALGDERQLVFYENRLKAMAVKVLRDHGIIREDAQGIALNVSRLTPGERAEIRRICDKKMEESLSPRGHSVSDQRSIVERGLNEACPFCQYNRTGEKPVENEYAFAKPDREPFKEGHTLIIPKRHVADCFDMSREEFDAVYDLLGIRRKQLLEADPAIQGFNVGFNSGAIAGQTVFHCHVHLIPRRPGDGEHPRGRMRRERPCIHQP